MESTRQGQDPRAKADQTTNDQDADSSARGVSGGGPADEEDIGTEEAGTEPPASADADGAIGSSSDHVRGRNSG
jgi:hypothetical protein